MTTALEVGGELDDRPTIPVPPPRESGVRLKVARVATPGATVDVVVCDLSRDPRSELYVPGPRPSLVKATPLAVLVLRLIKRT